jgi:hypothetical protein
VSDLSNDGEGDGGPGILVRAELDLPGETGRQARVFLVWLLCLASAVLVSVVRRPQVPERLRERLEEHEEWASWRRERVLVAVGVGLLLPISATLWLTHRRRRGGPHARGIFVEVTDDAELRVWGRGYGQRLRLGGAEVSERLCDVFTGRLGAWRQRRLRVRSRQPIAGMPSEIELATPAVDADLDLGLSLGGGEGDCIEVAREDYLRLVAAVRELAA